MVPDRVQDHAQNEVPVRHCDDCVRVGNVSVLGRWGAECVRSQIQSEAARHDVRVQVGGSGEERAAHGVRDQNEDPEEREDGSDTSTWNISAAVQGRWLDVRLKTARASEVARTPSLNLRMIESEGYFFMSVLCFRPRMAQ